MGVFADLIELALPVSCVCCHRPGQAWCTSCRPDVLLRRADLAAGFTTVSAGEYAGTLRTALLAYKERGRRQLTGQLAELLTAAVAALVPPGSATTLVTVPSRPLAARERGGDHIARLARIAGRRCDLEYTRALSLQAGVQDSAGLSTTQRIVNLDGRMRAARPPDAAGSAVILDDIVTTGATLVEARRALTAAGWQVLGAATIAATKRRWPAGHRGRTDEPML